MENVKKLLGKKIKNIRKTKGITQEELSERIKIDPKSLSCIEVGKNYPTPENLAKIAEALDVRICELFNFEYLVDSNILYNEMFENLKNNEKLIRLVYKFYNIVK